MADENYNYRAVENCNYRAAENCNYRAVENYNYGAVQNYNYQIDSVISGYSSQVSVYKASGDTAFDSTREQ